MSPAADYDRAVWSWAQHLRSGGTTPWSAWSAPAAPSPGSGSDDPPTGWLVPGAAQLELVRRVASGGPVAGFEEVADLVLNGSGPGRGLAAQPLSWPGPMRHRFGAPAVDPADVPVEELVRVGVGVLVELALTLDVLPGDHPPGRRLLPRWPTSDVRFEVCGAPVTADGVRRDLLRAGRREGGRRPRVLLVAQPLDRLLFEVWSARVQGGAPVRWRGFLRRWAGRTTLPSSADLPALARGWADRVGRDQVHVLVAPADPARAAVAALGPQRRGDRLPGSPGKPALPTGRVPWEVPASRGEQVRELSPAGVDLLRRANAALGVRAAGGELERARRRLVGRLGSGQGAVLTVPPGLRRWTRTRAEQLADELGAGDYPVHGHLEDLVPAVTDLPTAPEPDQVLAEALTAVRIMAERRPRTEARA